MRRDARTKGSFDQCLAREHRVKGSAALRTHPAIFPLARSQDSGINELWSPCDTRLDPPAARTGHAVSTRSIA
jgi:hypothetical protein